MAHRQGFPVGIPGNSFFARVNARSVSKANSLEEAESHFANHADRNVGNVGRKEDVVAIKNHLKQSANDAGFQNAIAKKNVYADRGAETNAEGAVFYPFRRHLQVRETGPECFGDSCGGGCGVYGCAVPPSGFNAANAGMFNVNKGSFFSQAKQGRESDANQRGVNQRLERHNLYQKGTIDANTKSVAGARAKAAGGFFNKNEAGQKKFIGQNNGLLF